MKIANMKIGTRLALSFGVMGVFLVLVLVFSVSMLSRVHDGTELIVNDRMPKIEAASELQTEIDDIAIALRNMMLNEDKADRQKQMADIEESRRVAKEQLELLQRSLRFAKAKDLAQRMNEANDKYLKGQDELIRRINSGSPEDAKAYLSNELRPVLAAYKKLIGEQLQLQKQFAQEFAESAAQTYANTRNLMIGLGALILAFAAALAYIITVSITRPLAKALKVANTVASGDLTSHIDVRSTDEMGQLLHALKLMNESLVDTVAMVRTGTETIATASSEVASGSLDLSSRTEEQASSLEETASSMEELTSTVKQNADNARQANAMAETASNVAAKGGEVIAKVVVTMDEINSSSTRITDIISVIDGIAFQTNILALNAAVEAARAGEQGRGFAVVAAEVRNLAQRSAAAAREIKTLIEDSTAKVENGGKLVNEAGATMQEIVRSVKHVTDIMAEITAASLEQTTGIEQINQAINQMDEVTQQNAALVEQASAASEAMQEQAAKLAQTVSIFKLDLGVMQSRTSVVMPSPSQPMQAKAPASVLRPAKRASQAAPKHLLAATADSSDD
ncbi:methyl-accepting chemotaxis protein [Herbaspirillum sp. ST 5-3]|uniref:methyl-accepting chemotaxis protein n=1 Tax=Oxalobacteraceae TaxID=75682 RepID=UPI0010A3A99F|nr:methyl-accepting chemotaxis protein [Herbaspirillum sp. ST 5-3]